MAGVRAVVRRALLASLLALAVPALAHGQNLAPIPKEGRHGHVHRVAEVRMVAKKGWRLAHGPTQAQVRRYRHALAHPIPNTRSRLRAVWQRQRYRYAALRSQKRLKKVCGVENTRACIVYAARHFGEDEGYAIYVAWKESGLRACPPENPSHFGLFQFDWDTWLGSPFDDNGNPCNPFWNSMAAMWYWARGETSRWVTY